MNNEVEYGEIAKKLSDLSNQLKEAKAPSASLEATLDQLLTRRVIEDMIVTCRRERGFWIGGYGSLELLFSPTNNVKSIISAFPETAEAKFEELDCEHSVLVFFIDPFPIFVQVEKGKTVKKKAKAVVATKKEKNATIEVVWE